MRKFSIVHAVLLLLLGSPLLANDIEDEIRELLVCVDIINYNIENIQKSEAHPSTRIVTRAHEDSMEYIIDRKMVLKRIDYGLTLQFSIEADWRISATLDRSARTFTVSDRNGKTVTGSYTETRDRKIDKVTVRTAAKSFATVDLNRVVTYLFRIGLFTGAFPPRPY